MPVLTMSALTGDGVEDVLDALCKYVPKPATVVTKAKNADDEDIEIACDPDGDLVIFIFKTLADPFLGKISYAKVVSGTLKSGADVYNPRSEKSEKLGSVFFVRARQASEHQDRRYPLQQGKAGQNSGNRIPASMLLPRSRGS